MQINEFNFNIQIEMKLDTKQKLMMVFVDIGVKASDTEETIGRCIVCCTFLIANFENMVVKNERNAIDLPQTVIDTLNSIAISTTRGIMFASFKGTFLHDALLPIVDPTRIIAQQI